MIEQLPTVRDLLKHQQELPAELRGNMLLLRFDPEIRRCFAGEFLRIHLTRDMLAAGEDDTFQAAVFQPHRVGLKRCPMCHQVMHQISEAFQKCRNPRCMHFDVKQQTGPVQGVVDVVVAPDFVTRREANGVEWIDRCCLVLDRRYSDLVLTQIYRTAGHLCDMNGWKLL